MLREDKQDVHIIGNLFNCLTTNKINNVEFLIRNNPEIKKYFIENFQFLTQNYELTKDKSFIPKYTKEFLNDDEFAIVKEIDLTQPSIKRRNVFEVYIRK
jgi:hypothetical protein